MFKVVRKQKTIWLIGLLMCSQWIEAQQNRVLTLNDCLEMANQNYPLVKQYALIEKSKEYSISNAQKGYLPQINVSGQASYQSAVTQVPISLPNMDIPTLTKDQYKLYAEVSQSVTNLINVKKQKEVINANSEVETQKVEVELYKLKERINNLFFGILLIDAQIQQNELLKKDIQNGIDKNKVAIDNGIALKSTADNLKAELLKADQRTIELKATRKGYADMLALFVGNPIDENITLSKPNRQIAVNQTINRPELKLYDLQKKSFEAEEKLLNSKIIPNVGLFVQGGFGKPALNMLSPDFEEYYIAGVRLSWNINSLFTHRNEKRILANNRKMVDSQKEIFLFNTNLTLKQQNADIVKMEELIEADKGIVKLRENVKNTTQNQLTYGMVTTNDYLIAVNAEDQAKLNLILHEIQLLMTEYNTQTTLGN